MNDISSAKTQFVFLSSSLASLQVTLIGIKDSVNYYLALIKEIMSQPTYHPLLSGHRSFVFYSWNALIHIVPAVVLPID